MASSSAARLIGLARLPEGLFSPSSSSGSRRGRRTLDARRKRLHPSAFGLSHALLPCSALPPPVGPPPRLAPRRLAAVLSHRISELLERRGQFAGESELALRGFSALTGVLLVALLYRLGREYFDAPAGIAAALLSAFNPFLVSFGQEARMYSLLAALSAASFLLFSVWLRSTRPPPSTSYGRSE